MRALLASCAPVFSVLIAGDALAANLIPGPNQPNYDAALASLAARYDLQYFTFNAAPFGLALDGYVPGPADHSLLVEFLAQTAEPDFFAFSMGRAVDAVVPLREGYDQLGMNGGVVAAGEAFRYAVLRDGDAPVGDVDAARAELLRAI